MNGQKFIIEILLADVLSFHDYLEQFFVMSQGIHDKGLLESAIHVPLAAWLRARARQNNE